MLKHSCKDLHAKQLTAILGSSSFRIISLLLAFGINGDCHRGGIRHWHGIKKTL